MFKNMKLGTKLIGSFVGLSLLTGVVGGIGLYYITAIEATLNEVTDIAAPTVETSDDLIANLWEATKVAEEIIADEEIEDITPLAEEFDKLAKEFDETFVELDELVSDEALSAALTETKAEHEEFVEHTKSMLNAHLTELNDEILAEKKMEEFDRNGDALIVMLEEFSNENEAEMAKIEEDADTLVEGSDNETAKKLNDMIGDLFEQDYPVVEASLKLERLVMELREISGEFLAEEDPTKLPAIREQFDNVYAQVAPHMEVLKNLAETPEDKQDAADLEKAFSVWDDVALGKGGMFDIYSQQLILQR